MAVILVFYQWSLVDIQRRRANGPTVLRSHLKKDEERRMSFMDLITGATINRGVDRWRATEGTVLIDVRSEEEYGQGYIPGSINIPLNDIERVLQEYPEKDTPIFVHCLTGSRSGQAFSFLKRSGYTKVENIGGIAGYQGEVIR